MVLLGSAHKVLTWFVEINSKPGVSGGNQRWSYKAFAFGNIFLSQNALSAPRAQPILQGMGDAAENLVRGQIKFEAFQSLLVAQMDKAKALQKERLLENPKLLEPLEKTVDALGQCALAIGLMAATTSENTHGK
ncbi:MAG: hypothetical protein CVU31_07055 [Betaproteobacteria bacterium HGW-Betaproteobacteria-4]|jgi:hypothetical protein|nr:MAG: hypothetical protein CVU31_07055 [Betaproteobacteria bacterium HGW-Betaproteobacteria-4]